MKVETVHEVEAQAARSYKHLLWLFFAAYFTFGFVLNVVGAIIPVVIREYRLSLFAGGLLAFAFYIAFGVCSIPAGWMADRIGAKPVVLVGVLLMGVGCGAIAWARTYVAITLFAFLIGAGIALLETAGNPLIAHLDIRENYHRNLTLTIGFGGIGAFAGPLCLSALELHHLPWRYLYLGYAGLCAILLVLLGLAQFPGGVKSAAEELRPREILKLLSHPIAVTYFLALFFYVGAEVGTASWIVKFFQQVHGLAEQRIIHPGENPVLRILPSLPLLAVSLFWGLQGAGRLSSGPGIHFLGPRTMLRLYAVGALACLLFATFAPTGWAAVGFMSCGFFTSVLFTLLFSGAVHSFRQSQGTISGLLITASIGGAIIPPLVGLTADHFGLQVAMVIPAFCFAFVLSVSLWGKATYE
jgi:fucose permease